MTPQPYSFTEPASRAWQRMAHILLRPPDVRTWLVLGFSAFLAGLGGRGGSTSYSTSSDEVERQIEGAESLGDVLESLLANGLWIALGALGCVVLVVVILAVVWISSRGKLIFLDNVLGRRAHIVEPWKRLAPLGNSLFLYQIVFFFSCVALFVLLAGVIASTVGLAALADVRSLGAALPAMAAACAILLAILAIFYAVFFVDSFVVPLMHRYEVGVLDGWRRFLAIFGERPLPFLLCGLLVLFVAVALTAAAVVFGLMTCCVGFLLLATPYLSSVLLLPVSVFYRGFTVEFLAQFDADLLPPAEAATVAAGEVAA